MKKSTLILMLCFCFASCERKSINKEAITIKITKAYQCEDILPLLVDADKLLAKNNVNSVKAADTLNISENERIAVQQRIDMPLRCVVILNTKMGGFHQSSCLGSSFAFDTAEANTYLSHSLIKNIFPVDLAFTWKKREGSMASDETLKPITSYSLVGIGNDAKTMNLQGDAIENIAIKKGNFGSNQMNFMSNNGIGVEEIQLVTLYLTEDAKNKTKDFMKANTSYWVNIVFNLQNKVEYNVYLTSDQILNGISLEYMYTSQIPDLIKTNFKDYVTTE